ncbi:hypothetical protein ACH5RR_031275 [Cinchona calisaya]|uniref:Alpha/beta hydrolase fold-3 domain-containing protein n=1 Tax=Cinchona calisaya TaxID=153742 RepID=A0ABD2YK00_9GENT
MASNLNEIVTDLSPLIKVYKDGKVERLISSQYAPPSLQDPTTNVSSKDVTISPEISARIYLPNNINPNQKIPIFVYHHGGGFCLGSVFSFIHHRYISLLVSQAKVLAISLEYRLAPEHPLPAAYQDSWAALQWVASHRDDENSNVEKEPWLIEHGNFEKLYLGGDSAGANIVHNVVMRAGVETLYGDVKIFGAFLCQPYFWSLNSRSKGSDEGKEESNIAYRMWMLAYPSAPGGIDNSMINPMADDAPCLSGLACSRLFVTVAEKDPTREREILYVEAVRKSGWKGELELFEAEGKGHGFHLLDPEDEEAKIQMGLLASFLMY